MALKICIVLFHFIYVCITLPHMTKQIGSSGKASDLFGRGCLVQILCSLPTIIRFLMIFSFTLGE
jgi:hypothetical protein